eukprot:Nk52_evm20s2309 gene=Nk52_evmTU20s2309
MCWLQGTCMVLEEGGGAVPAEIAVTLNLMYIGDVDYLWKRQATFQNMPFPLLDSLNMTFTPPSVARRNVRGIVTQLFLILQDFEEIGPFLSQGFNELTDLTITVAEQNRRTRVRSDMLTGIPKLERLKLLPKFWYGRVSSLMLLSVKGTSIRHIPTSYKNIKENVFGLQSFNLDWSYEWSCCDLAYVEELDPSSSLIALDPSDVAIDTNLILLINQLVQLNGPGTSFTSKRCVFKKRKMRYFEFRKAVPDFKDVCSIDTNSENKATNSLFLTLWVILLIQLYCMTVVYAIHFGLNKAKGPSLVVEIAFPGSYLFKNAMYELNGAYYQFPGDDGPQKLKVMDFSLEYLAGYREVPSGYQYTATVDEDLYYN